MNDFRRIMFSTTEAVAVEYYTKAIENLGDLGTYDNCIERLRNLWERRVDWVIAYRDHHSRGNFTNNFAEITVRIFKENVLKRRKSYNAASLVDIICSELEDYYRSRLLDFANCCNNSPFLQMEKLTAKGSYVKSKEALKDLGNGVYVVPSEKGEKEYKVDTMIGCCECEAGLFGKFCKHAAIVMKYFSSSFPNRPPVKGFDRHIMAVIALGSVAKPLQFYQALNEVGANEENVATVATERSAMDVDEGTAAIIDPGPSGQPPSSKFIDPRKVKEFTDAFTQELLANQSNESLSDAFDQFTTKFFVRCTGQPSRLSTLLSSASTSVLLRNRAGAKIPVQPTAKSRRRNNITRGTSSRLAAGRLPAALAAKSKCGRAPSQKLRNLGKAVRENRPNAKSHN